MRNRAYYRKERAKHIRRKKRICERYGWAYYEDDGRYSKGKIHCSCPLCAAKSKNGNWKHSDLIKIERLKQQEKEYI